MGSSGSDWGPTQSNAPLRHATLSATTTQWMLCDGYEPPHGNDCPERVGMRSAFVAYASIPVAVGETVARGVAAARTAHPNLAIWTWEDLDIGGRLVRTEILTAIDQADVFIADISSLNLNVVYEVGYAIGKGKPLRLVRNLTLDTFPALANRVGIFDTLGWVTYTNSEELADYLIREIDEARSVEIDYQYNRLAPVFLLDAKQKTDYAITVKARIKKEIVSFRSFDPQETARLPAHEAIMNVAASFGVVVTLLPEGMPDASEHNIRASFIAGLAAGMPRELLLLQLGEGPVPLDFRDIAYICRRPEQIAEALHAFAPRIMEGYQLDLPKAPGTDRTPIQNLNLGASVAENEFRDLQTYYLEVDAYHRALRGEVRVVLGRKGSGKTALFARLRDEKRENRRNIVVDIKPEGYKLMKSKEDVLCFLQLGTLEHTITAFWEYVLLLDITYKLLEKDRSVYGRDVRIYEPYLRLHRLYAVDEYDSAGDFSERMSRLLNDIRLEIQRRYGRKADIRLSNAEVTEIVHRHPIAELREVLVNYLKTKNSVWVLVDNIDKGWPTHGVKEEDLMLVRTLLDATGKLERSVEEANIECKTVVFLRNDVYELLVQYTPDRGKVTKALVDWTDQGALKQLLRRRLIFSGLNPGSFADMWTQICVPGVLGQDSAEFIVERCLMRPRALLNAIAYVRGTAVNRGHSIIQADDVVTGLRTHSHDLVEEVSLEIRDVAPEIENAVYLLLDAPRRISRDDLLYLFISGGIEDTHWDKLINLFLWYGVLGVARQDGGAIYIYSVSYNFAMLQATVRKAAEELVFVVNPAFDLALGREEDVSDQPGLFH